MERRIIKKDKVPIHEETDEELNRHLKRTPSNVDEAMSASEEEFIKFVEEQISKMDRKLLFWGESSPPIAVLNKALMDHGHVLLALTSLYEEARWKVEALKEKWGDWYSHKFIEIRTEVNTNDIARNKWYTKDEIECMMRVKYKDEYNSLRAEMQLAEHERSTLQRLIDGWSSYQYVLTQLSKNSIAEIDSAKREGYTEYD